ncbi:MAG: enolase C-terminal domain-like protein, partial [Candidatus Bathyarchaeia archaeon]
MKLHIGIDDTDSPRKGCTTYIAAVLVETLDKLGCKFIDYPNLVRLNPNIPWKTRGNGAVCIRLECDDFKIDQIKKITTDIVEKHSDMAHERTDPAIVFLKGEIPYELSRYSSKAIKDIVSFKEAVKMVKKFNIEFAEQPVPAENLKGLIEVKRNSPIPIMADESVHSPEDAIRLIKA